MILSLYFASVLLFMKGERETLGSLSNSEAIEALTLLGITLIWQKKVSSAFFVLLNTNFSPLIYSLWWYIFKTKTRLLHINRNQIMHQDRVLLAILYITELQIFMLLSHLKISPF